MAIALRSSIATNVTNGTVVNPSFPVGLAVGDVCIVHIAEEWGYNCTPPAGWNVLGFQRGQMKASTPTDSGWHWLFYKVITAADLAVGNLGAFTFSTNVYAMVRATAFSGCNVADPIAMISSRDSGDVASTDYNIPLAYDYFGNGMSVIIGSLYNSAGIPGGYNDPATYTRAYDEHWASGKSNGYMAVKLLGASAVVPEVVVSGAGGAGSPSTPNRAAWHLILRDANSLGSLTPWVRGSASRESDRAATHTQQMAGVHVGDVLILTYDDFNVNAVGPTLPAGWNLLAARMPIPGGALGSRTMYWKFATATDAASKEISMTGLETSYTHSTQLIVVANGGTPQAPATTTAQASSAPTAPAITTTQPNMLLIETVWTVNDWTASLVLPAGYNRVRVSKSYFTSNGLGDRASYGTSVKIAAAAGVQPAAADGPAVTYWADSHIAVPVNNVAPSAPGLVAPADGVGADLTTPTFQWTFSDPNPPDTQSGFYFRRKLVGAPSYEYYNATTGLWQAGEVKIVQAAQSFTFPAGKWVNGQIYNWSIATEDQANSKGPYATDFTVRGGNAASVTVTAPSGSITDNVRPPVTWTESDPEGDPQETYQVIIEHGAFGTVPGLGAQDANSGEVANAAARAWVAGLDLVNGTTYRAFVRVRTAGQYSAWSYSNFTISLTPPPTPAVTATYEAATNRVRLDIANGLAGQTYRVQRSDDGGVTWNTIRGGDDVPRSAAVTTVYDYEAPPNRAAQYRASTRTVV